MNDEKKADPKMVRRDFGNLALDWVDLHTRMPKPIAQENARRPKYRTYGHPAEWASDKCAQIADMFRNWHDMVAEHRNETPAPPAAAAEQVRVAKGWKYLEPRFEQLVEMVEPDALKEIPDLHREIRNALGFNSPRQFLPIPCPGIDCGLLTLFRDNAVGRDLIRCGSCRYQTVDDEDGRNYRWLIRVCLNALIDTSDLTESGVS